MFFLRKNTYLCLQSRISQPVSVREVNIISQITMSQQKPAIVSFLPNVGRFQQSCWSVAGFGMVWCFYPETLLSNIPLPITIKMSILEKMSIKQRYECCKHVVCDILTSQRLAKTCKYFQEAHSFVVRDC